MKQLPSNIAIIGVGLIGGSIAMGLKELFGGKITISGNCSSLKRSLDAKEKGIIDHIISADFKSLKNSDLIIIATPVFSTLKILGQLNKFPINCPVMDVGSTKGEIEKHLRNLEIDFIGTHPMAGSEIGGFENADPLLFRNKSWIICPNEKSRNKDLIMIKNLITQLGAIPVIMSARKHDEIAAWSSHIHLAISSIIMRTCAKEKNWESISQMASTGFRDTTRLASHNPKMILDILLTNKVNLLRVSRKLIDEIKIFNYMLEKEDAKELNDYLINSKSIRDNWINNKIN